MNALRQCAAVTLPTTIRWREIVPGRGGRLARRVRECRTTDEICVLVQSLRERAFSDEIRIETAQGEKTSATAAAILDWASGSALQLRRSPCSAWLDDEDRAFEWAAAIDGVRIALGRLAGTKMVTNEWVDAFIDRLHVAVQSLPASPLPLWRP